MANAQKTQKQFYMEIAELLADHQDIVEFCEKKIGQIDNRKPSTRKPNPEVVERRQAVLEFLQGQTEPMVISDIADALGFSSPQTSGAMRGLVNAGQVKIVEPEQKSKPKMYQIVDATEQF